MRIRLFLLSFLITLTTFAFAQGPQKFDPKRFEAQLEQYITTKAGLTPGEAAKFFPLYREMRKKQFAYFEYRPNKQVAPGDDEAAAKMIRKRDENEVQMKLIQQEYHNKFMQIMPASKVFCVIKAESDFHRRMFKRAAQKHEKKQ